MQCPRSASRCPCRRGSLCRAAPPPRPAARSGYRPPRRPEVGITYLYPIQLPTTIKSKVFACCWRHCRNLPLLLYEFTSEFISTKVGSSKHRWSQRSFIVWRHLKDDNIFDFIILSNLHFNVCIWSFLNLVKFTLPWLHFKGQIRRSQTFIHNCPLPMLSLLHKSLGKWLKIREFLIPLFAWEDFYIMCQGFLYHLLTVKKGHWQKVKMSNNWQCNKW